MGSLVNFVSQRHKSTKRSYLERMIDQKVDCMKKAKEFEYDYWDGDRKYGYGGYKYIPDWWKPVAEQMIKKYKLILNFF